MATDAHTVVFHYHNATKHHPYRYARSLGYLDWATQPEPFRRFSGAPLTRLFIPAADEDWPAYERAYELGAIPPRPVDFESISRFFYLSLAISAWKQAGESRWALRCNPSSGNLHPTEGYALLPAMEQLHPQPGTYHYAPREHGLERRSSMDEEVWRSLMAPFPRRAFLVGLTSIYWREAWKYGERAFRYCQHDAGHALAALRMAAAALGWRMVMLEELADGDVACLLGVNREQDFVDAEREQPEMLAVVDPTDTAGRVPPGIDPAIIAAVAQGPWIGRANQLSRTHAMDWEIIDAVAEATRKPRTQCRSDDIKSQIPDFKSEDEPDSTSGSIVESPGELRSRTSIPAPRSGMSAFQIIRQRRSALAFDGQTSIDEQTFYGMLSRVTPVSTSPLLDPCAPFRIPFEVISWSPRIHLFLFVHLVEGLSPGLYALVRDPRRLETLQRATLREFLWSKPAGCPEDLPLYSLMSVDCRRAAAQLSLGQEIAGASAFSMGMIADFDAALAENGPWFYRNLYWEAGMVGQVLYLEAEAAGVRATGIGAYFDDWVHEVFGFQDHRFQSLYHFTVGGHVEDKRLTTLPSYPAPEPMGTFDAP